MKSQHKTLGRAFASLLVLFSYTSLYFSFPLYVFADETLTLGSSGSDGSDNITIGARHKMAASFSPTADATSITVNLGLFNNQDHPPTGNYRISIQTDSGGVPDGVDLIATDTAKNSLSGNSCTSSPFPAVSKTLSVSLSSTTVYWVVIDNLDLSTYLQVCDNYSDGVSTNFQWNDGSGYYPWTAAKLYGSVDLVADSGGGGTTTPTTTPGTGSTTPYNGLNAKEQLFVLGVIIYFVSLMAWPHIFHPIRRITP